ncbi:hypothetical protein Tco_0857381 [Tanacetum coccineum]|uniref:Uncharacterized protein n=1 Tax=Tanacetum coccineum TaxID=301880 RepID=A0ABQ5B7X5_9ASTR
MVIREPETGFFYFNTNFDLVFQRESEFRITSTVQLIRLLKHINLDSPEVGEMYKIMEIEIESRDDVNKAKEIVSAKHQLAVKGLSECRASESNIKCIQVKYIVKKVKDYLKTYSSAGMDISWEIHDLNFRGSSCRNLFVLSSPNRERFVGFTDLMRQKSNIMKHKD